MQIYECGNADYQQTQSSDYLRSGKYFRMLTPGRVWWGLSCRKIFQPDGLMGSYFHAFAIFDQEKLRRLMLHAGIDCYAVGYFTVLEKIEVPGRIVMTDFRFPASVDAIQRHGADGASGTVFKNKDRLLVGCFQQFFPAGH